MKKPMIFLLFASTGKPLTFGAENRVRLFREALAAPARDDWFQKNRRNPECFYTGTFVLRPDADREAGYEHARRDSLRNYLTDLLPKGAPRVEDTDDYVSRFAGVQNGDWAMGLSDDHYAIVLLGSNPSVPAENPGASALQAALDTFWKRHPSSKPCLVCGKGEEAKLRGEFLVRRSPTEAFDEFRRWSMGIGGAEPWGNSQSLGTMGQLWPTSSSRA